MPSLVSPLIVRWALPLCLLASPLALADCAAVLEHEFQALRSNDSIDMCERFAGKPLVVVNTASFCGYTPQFKGLEAVYQRYRDQGLEVIGVPSNDFRQEAEDKAAIADVCYVNYGVTFAMTEPQRITGSDAHPFYQALTEQAGEAPGWNFHKYVLDRNGRVVGSFPSKVAPDNPEFLKAIELAL